MSHNDRIDQERDMRQLRTDHEVEIERLMREIEQAVMDLQVSAKLEAKTRLRRSLRPLLDAAYGPMRTPYDRAPVRDANTVTAIKFPKPRCIQCGAHVTDVGPFCEECSDALEADRWDR